MEAGATLVDAHAAARREGRTLVLCDVSPPRSAAIESLPAIAAIAADYYCCAYAPGRAVRLDSLAMAVRLHQATGRGAMFNLATRDMNVLALQTHLLGAQALGVSNVVVVKGDDFTARDQTLTRAVHDITPTGLLRAITAMNSGTDFRGSPLRAPSALCAGATIDLARPHEAEAKLAARKLRAGARFLITQPIYAPEEAERFHATYRRVMGDELAVPVFWGFAVLAAESITFGALPERWHLDLERGRPGADLAAQELRHFTDAGLNALYLMPPILRGGARDYAAAAAALKEGLRSV